MLAYRVGEVRTRRGMKQRELGDRAGLRREAVTMIENGKRQVSVDELFRLAAALNVAPLHLLVPLDDSELITIDGKPWPAAYARAWVRGEASLADDPGRGFIDYLAEIPDAELQQKIRGTLRGLAGTGPPRALEREFMVPGADEAFEERVADIAWEIKEGDAIRAAEERANERRRNKKEGDDA